MKHNTVTEFLVTHLEKIMNKVNTIFFNMFFATLYVFLISFKSTEKYVCLEKKASPCTKSKACLEPPLSPKSF